MSAFRSVLVSVKVELTNTTTLFLFAEVSVVVDASSNLPLNTESTKAFTHHRRQRTT